MELLYKYLPNPKGDAACFLDNMSLRITQPGALNDPFESYSFYEATNATEIVNEAFASSNNRPAKAARMIAGQTVSAFHNLLNYRSEINTTWGILSLSKRWDNTIMWAHYANQHRGFCIGLDPTDPFFASARKEGLLDDVTYISQRLPCSSFHGESPIALRQLFYKSTDWMYEQEARLVCRLDSCGPTDLKTVDENSYPIYLKRVPVSAIKEIMIGYKCGRELKKSISVFASKNGIHNRYQVEPSHQSNFSMIRSACA